MSVGVCTRMFILLFYGLSISSNYFCSYILVFVSFDT